MRRTFSRNRSNSRCAAVEGGAGANLTATAATTTTAASSAALSPSARSPTGAAAQFLATTTTATKATTTATKTTTATTTIAATAGHVTFAKMGGGGVLTATTAPPHTTTAAMTPLSQPPPVAAAAQCSTYTRRESLIKPTWQHITPGQIPPRTLDKINGIATSDDSDDSDDYYRKRPSIVVYQNNNNNDNNNLHAFAASGGYNSAVAAGAAPFMRRESSSAHSRAFGLIVQSDGAKAGSGSCGVVGSAAEGGAGISRALKRMVSSTNNTSKSSTDDEEDYDLLGKVIMLGDSGVGKTCLLIRFRECKFLPNYYITTVGIDFRNKVVVVDGTRVKLQIWDTAGQERFRSVTHAYYRDAHALLLLYDVTNKTTFDNIRAWLGEIREYAQESVVIVLIGNKADCSNSERQVKREDGERLATQHNVPFMETSAKTGLNVELAFAAVARQLKSRGGYKNGDDGKFNVHEFVRDNNTQARTICAQCKM